MLFSELEEEKDIAQLWKLAHAKVMREYKSRGDNPFYFKRADGWKPSKEPIVKMYHQSSVFNTKAVTYVLDPKKTKDGDLYFNSFGIHTDAKSIENTTHQWNSINKRLHSDYQKKADERDKRGLPPRKNNPRYYTHIVLSIYEKPSRKNVHKLINAVNDVQFNNISSFGFDSFFTIHRNTDHCHAHLIIQNTNTITGKKIDFSKQFTWSMRKDFAEALRREGLNYHSTMKNKDSLEIKNKPSKKHERKKDYFTNSVVKHFGEDIKPYLKKMMIEKNSKNEKTSSKANEVLTLMRNLDSPEIKADILSRWQIYQQQKEKYSIKQQIIQNHPEIDSDDIKAYVDTVYARRDKLLKSANSKNQKSIDLFNNNESILLGFPAVSKENIINFSTFRNKSNKTKQWISNLTAYGEPGKEYYKLLISDLRKLDKHISKKHPSEKYLFKARSIQDEISKLVTERLDPDTVSNRLFDRNLKGQTEFLTPRLKAAKTHIAESAGVDEKSINIDNIFKYYIMKRGSDPEGAYMSYKALLNKYQQLIIANDQDAIGSFQKQLSIKLDNSPKSNLDPNLEISPKRTPSQIGPT